ncbi:MAG: glycosyltransferase family 4 protein [Bryobacterales bacterium]|nr:glycosyltransferase family 4 protein [Bryobacterales bacterium]
MRPLIVAPSSTPPNMESEIEEGKRPRLDYYELARRLGAPFLDDNPPWTQYNRNVRSIEKRLRLDFFWASKIAKKVRQEGYDTVVSLSERIGIPLAHALDQGIKHITLSHKPLSRYKLAAVKALGTFIHWNVLLTFSMAEAEELRRTFGADEDRVRPITWGIDTDYFRPSENGLQIYEPPHVLSMGVSNRDYPTLIEAMRRIPHVTCHICPTSAWEPSLGALANKKLPPNVVIKSYDHPLVIRQAYERCKFAVVPMQPTDQWSAGCTSVLQPQAMGKPVVATKLPGLAEYVIGGETGLLVNVGDPAAMAQAIDTLWRDGEKTAAMGARARQWVNTSRSLNGTLDQLTAIIHEIGSS